MKIIASTTVNDNLVELVQEGNKHYIYWGEAIGEYQTKTELLTPSGRIPSKTSAYKKFLKACKAAQYLKFEKL